MRRLDPEQKRSIWLISIFKLISAVVSGLDDTRYRDEHRNAIRGGEVFGIASPATTENTW